MPSHKRLFLRLGVDRHRRDALRQVNDQLVQQTHSGGAPAELVATVINPLQPAA